MIPVHQRILRRVERTPEGCWRWPGAATPSGYGHARRTNRREDGMVYVHRAMFEAVIGPISGWVEVEHACHTAALIAGTCEGGKTCRHRRCANPAHLELLSRRDNLLRGNTGPGLNAAKTHCIRGHPFSGANLILRRSGVRECRTCSNARRRQFGEPTIWLGETDSVLRHGLNRAGA